MKTKHALSLLVVIILATGIALAQEPSTPPPAPEPDDAAQDMGYGKRSGKR